MRKFNFVVCGGTFDHFHKGHEEFLKFALRQGQRLLIGLTTEVYLKHYGHKGMKDILETYKVREKNLKEFLQKEGTIERVRIVPIDDIAGPAVYDQSLPLQAIVATKDTQKGAEFINAERLKMSLPSLQILTFPFVRSTDQKIVSSSRIRSGEINRKGNTYLDFLWFNKTFNITSSLRKTLSLPFGRLLQTKDIDFSNLCPSNIITVGDVVTRLFNEKKVNQKISVIDYHVQRKKIFSDLKDLNFLGKEHVINAQNPAGFLTPSLWQAVDKAFSLIEKIDRLVIQIEGEEDLSVLPLVLYAPLGFTLFYGQPGRGVVQIAINEDKKKEAYVFAKRFK